MAGNVLHPTLSQLIPFESIPNELEAIRDALQSVFDDIYVTNLIVSKGFEGHYGFYSLTLTTYNSLGINLPIGDDLKLVLNPTIQGTTQLPVRFDYSWLIIRYIKSFSLDGFDNSVHSILQILFDLAKITPNIILREAISGFYSGDNFIQDFINEFNTQYNQDISTDLDDTLTYDQQIDYVAYEIQQLDINILDLVFEMKINTRDGLNNLKILFRNMFRQIGDTINEVIKLNFRISIEELSAGLQFPRKWLVPVYTNDMPPIPNLNIDDPLPEGYYSVLKFNIGSLEYSSKGGFKFEQTNSFELNRSMIGNTGLIVEFEGLKVDLSRDSNIPEADIDGRPVTFMGAYADYVAITLPKKWFKDIDDTTAKISGYNLLVGTGGVSGTIALEAIGGDNTLWAKIGSSGGFKAGFNLFDISFKQNKVVSSNIRGKLEIEKFVYPEGAVDDNGVPIPYPTKVLINIDGHLSDDGDFNLTASAEPPYPIEYPGVFTYHLKSVELGQEDDNFYLGTSGTLQFEGFLKEFLKLGPI